MGCAKPNSKEKGPDEKEAERNDTGPQNFPDLHFHALPCGRAPRGIRGAGRYIDEGTLYSSTRYIHDDGAERRLVTSVLVSSGRLDLKPERLPAGMQGHDLARP